MKPSKNYEEYLKHILDEINYLLNHSENLTFDEFLNNETLKRAFIRIIEIIGEAAKKIPFQIQNKHNNIEWKKIIGMRDKLIHKYFGVDYQLMWDVIKNHIPKLKPKIAFILK